MIESRSPPRAVALLSCLLCIGAVADEDAGGARVSPSRQWSATMSRADVALGRTDADHDDAYVYACRTATT